MIVPGGGISPACPGQRSGAQRWVNCRANFFVHVLSLQFKRLILEKLAALHAAGRLQFLGAHAGLADAQAFAPFLAPLREIKWVVYARPPFGGPEAVLTYLSCLHPLHRPSRQWRELQVQGESGEHDAGISGSPASDLYVSSVPVGSQILFKGPASNCEEAKS